MNRLHPIMQQALQTITMLPRDRTPHRSEDHECYYCGAAMLNGSDGKRDLAGRRFHPACYEAYYDGYEDRDELAMREQISLDISEFNSRL